MGKMKEFWADNEEKWNMWEYEFYHACKEQLNKKNKGKKNEVYNNSSRSSVSKRQRRK